MSPGLLTLLAVVAVGGLVVLGFQAESTGKVALNFQACCTTETYQNAPTGFIQGNAITTTESCWAGESASTCCLRNVASRSELPIRLLGAKINACQRPSPDISYPMQVRYVGTY